MRKLSLKPNTVAPDTDFPHGRIKNKTSPAATDGTAVNENVYGDFHQFFEQLMADGGVVANGLPEGFTNGFQLNEALGNFAGRGAWKNSDTTPTISAGAVFSGTPISRYRILGKTIEWYFKAQMTPDAFTSAIVISKPSTYTLKNGQSNFVTFWKNSFVVVLLDNIGFTISKIDGSDLSDLSGAFFSITMTFEIA